MRSEQPAPAAGQDRFPAAGEPEPLLVADWRRRVFALYAAIRADPEPERAWGAWREARDTLFAGHPASPVPPGRRPSFRALDAFPYDPQLRVTAELELAPPVPVEIGASAGEPVPFDRFATVRFSIVDEECALDLYWLRTYGGGIFLPFADATSGETTYAAGRYLLDTVKGADLGTEDGRLVLDFNFAYNPSCSYDPRWACPLAPLANRLRVSVEGGERTTSAHATPAERRHPSA